MRLITEKSLEEAMYARARYTLHTDHRVLQAGRFDNKSTQEEQGGVSGSSLLCFHRFWPKLTMNLCSVPSLKRIKRRMKRAAT